VITIAELAVADDADAWTAAGFTVEDGVARIGTVRGRLQGTQPGQRGVVEWHLRDARVPGDGAIDGLVTRSTDVAPTSPSTHPNGSTFIDHVVVATPDYDRTISALTDAGFELRRERDTGSASSPLRQGFFRAGEVIVEVVGPNDGAPGPAGFFGLAIVVDDLDATKVFFGDRLSEPKPAVQPGRRIATLQHRALGLTTAIAFMTV
jgi:hypothetical protein